MSTTKTEVAAGEQSSTKAKTRSDSIIDRALGLLSSVRFGIILLILLLVCCMVGMLIVQQNTESFREYYASLTPAQRTIYGALGFFNIYHSWYFTLLLATTALNIILSSIDRFPTAWSYIRKPRRAASPAFTRAQMFSAVREANGSRERIAERIVAAWRKRGMRAQVSKEENRTTVFAQRNAWNRMGAYAVHLALLLIFVGGFLTSRYSTGGSMEIMPGRSSTHFTTFASGLEDDQARRVALPFEVECADLQQELIRPEGGLDVMNTVDWLSYIRIKDGGQEIAALVHLNSPFDHRGYRFFQSSFLPEGNARQITIQLANGREATIPRNTEVDVEGVGRVSYTNFYPDFTLHNGKAASASGEYANPVAELRIQARDGATRRAYAFNRRMMDEKPDSADEKIVLKDFEKVATSHTLTVQYDPGRLPVYAGFALLTVALGAVFFFAHQRVWAVIEGEGKGSRIYFGGNTNRNRPAFEGRFNTLVNSATGREE
ncbi:MAG: cytochrome c biogenesis protein ResB [Acidobacteriota bacterium]